MVPGAAQRMAGYGDAFLRLWCCRQLCSSPNLFPLLCTFLYHLSNCPPSSAIPRNAVGLQLADPKLGRAGAMNYENLNIKLLLPRMLT